MSVSGSLCQAYRANKSISRFLENTRWNKGVKMASDQQKEPYLKRGLFWGGGTPVGICLRRRLHLREVGDLL